MELRPFRDAGPGPMEFGITVQVSTVPCEFAVDKADPVGLSVRNGQGDE